MSILKHQFAITVDPGNGITLRKPERVILRTLDEYQGIELLALAINETLCSDSGLQSCPDFFGAPEINCIYH